MYRILDENGNFITQIDSPRYVRVNEKSGAWIQCTEDLAECIAIDGVRYSLVGKDKVEDAPVTVYVYPLDDAMELYHATKNSTLNAADIELLGYAIEKMAVEIVERLENGE